MRFSVSKNLMLFLIMLMFIQPVEAKPAEKISDDRFVCVEATSKYESEYEIKKHLLTTISNVETGRWDESLQKRVTWPWTVNVRGKGYHYNSKDEAIAAIKEFQSKGIKSIDVGCMQISLFFHGKEFKSVEDALDPSKNVEYAAKFLKKLHASAGNDWMKAASHYHSKKPKKARKYQNKLMAAYNDVRKSLNSETVTSTLKPTIAKEDIDDGRLALYQRANKASKWREARLEEYRKSKIK